MKKMIVWAAALLLMPMLVFAKEAAPLDNDPALQARVMNLSAELRCLVCQGQSLAESHADFAKDMQREIRNKMAEGMTDAQVVDYLVQRYGDYIRYRPPLKSTTVLLWFGPALLLALGVGILYFNLWQRRKRIQEQPLSDEERRRAEALLRDETGDSKA